jgi:SAM-dependent methyltransferase
MNDREYEIMFRREDAYWWYRGMRAVTRAFAPRIFARERGGRALDAGCGTGRNLVDLAAGGPVVGVDVSLRALGFARRRGAAPLVCASVEALPFHERAFAAVLSRDVLYMVPDDARAAREMSRVLSPGGTLALSAPAFGSLAGAHDTAVGALRRYTTPGIGKLLEEAGLPVRRSTYANFFLAAPIWFLRKVTGARARGRPREEVRSDFGLAPEPLEEILFLLLSLEARLLGAGVNLPFGVSALVVAERPGPGQGTSEEAK